MCKTRATADIAGQRLEWTSPSFAGIHHIGTLSKMSAPPNCVQGWVCTLTQWACRTYWRDARVFIVEAIYGGMRRVALVAFVLDSSSDEQYYPEIDCLRQPPKREKNTNPRRGVTRDHHANKTSLNTHALPCRSVNTAKIRSVIFNTTFSSSGVSCSHFKCVIYVLHINSDEQVLSSTYAFRGKLRRKTKKYILTNSWPYTVLCFPRASLYIRFLFFFRQLYFLVFFLTFWFSDFSVFVCFPFILSLPLFSPSFCGDLRYLSSESFLGIRFVVISCYAPGGNITTPFW